MSARASALQPAVIYEEAIASVVDRMFLNARGEPVSDRDADEVVERLVKTALHLQLATRRRNGLGGWHVGQGRSAKMLAELQDHIAGGRMLDAIRCAAQLHARAHLYGPDA